MGDIAQALGQTFRLPIKRGDEEEILLVSPITQAIKGEFEAQLKCNARAASYAMRKDLDKETFADVLAAMNAKIATGHYAYHGAASLAYQNTDEGMAYMLFLMLRVHQPEITTEDARALIVDYPLEMTALWREMAEATKEANAKNQPAPAAPGN